MRRRIIVQAGQRYVRIFQEGAAHQQIWEVASLYPDTAQIQHARLVNVSNRSETKTLSCQTLDGRHGFSLIGAYPPHLEL